MPDRFDFERRTLFEKDIYQVFETTCRGDIIAVCLTADNALKVSNALNKLQELKEKENELESQMQDVRKPEEVIDGLFNL